MQFNLSVSQFLISGKDGRKVQLGQVPSVVQLAVASVTGSKSSSLLDQDCSFQSTWKDVCPSGSGQGASRWHSSQTGFPCLCFTSFC